MCKKCDETIEKAEKARREWAEKWPNHCKTCEGHGEFHFTENGAPHGAGYWPMDMSEPCDDCTGKGICPRCGAVDAIDEEGYGPCEKCGWKYDDLGMPPEPEIWGCPTMFDDLPKNIPDIYQEVYEQTLGMKYDEDGRLVDID